MKRRASDERSRPVARQQRRHRKGRTGRLSCFLAVLACGLVCYLVSVLHLFRAHARPPRFIPGSGAGTAAKEKPLLGRAVQFFATKQTKLCAQNVHAPRTSRVTRPRLVYDDKKD